MKKYRLKSKSMWFEEKKRLAGELFFTISSGWRILALCLVIDFSNSFSNDWLIDRVPMIDWLRLITWLVVIASWIDRLFVRLIVRPLIGRLIDWLIDRSIDWLIDTTVAWMFPVNSDFWKITHSFFLWGVNERVDVQSYWIILGE